MSEHSDIVDEKQPPGGDVSPKKQSNVFVNSSALVLDKGVTPIYAVLKSQSKQMIQAWLWVLATAIFCAWAISFTYAVFISSSPVPRAYDWSPATTIQLVNITSHVVVLLTAALVGAIFDALCWALILRTNGATLRTFLVTQKNTGLLDAGSLFLAPGTHRKWSIMRFIIAAVGWVVGVLLLAHINVERVYTTDQTFPVIAGIADFHSSVQTLEKSNVLTNLNSTTSSFQETSINMMVTGMTRSIMTDPTFVVDVVPERCTGSNCKALFLPGGLTLVRQPNGSALNFAREPEEDSVVIVHDAPGYQLEFSPSNYTFNHTTDCTMAGFAISSFYSCIVFTGDTITSGFRICPFSQMSKATCESDTSWTNSLDATISLVLFQRNATVAYDRSNFSILSIEKISDTSNATFDNLVDDFHKMFQIMYPAFQIVLSDFKGIVDDFNSIWPDLTYWASVYCVQSELASAQWLFENDFPTWVTGSGDILKGLLTLPIQFGTLLWQHVDIASLPPSLKTNASTARVAYRPRSPLWTVALFAALTLALVVWAIICLLYVHFSSYGKAEEEHSQAIKAAFQRGNPFDVEDKGFWSTLSDFFLGIFGRSKTANKGTDEVVARSLHNEFLIAVDRSEG